MKNAQAIRSLITCCVLVSGVFAAPTQIADESGDGISVRRGAVVLFGTATNSSQPGSVKFKKLQRLTKEWRTIRADGVRKGTARYDILTTRMNERIRRAVRAAADKAGCDCVVRKSDVVDARGLTIRDLTDDVKDRLAAIKVGAP